MPIRFISQEIKEKQWASHYLIMCFRLQLYKIIILYMCGSMSALFCQCYALHDCIKGCPEGATVKIASTQCDKVTASCSVFRVFRSGRCHCYAKFVFRWQHVNIMRIPFLSALPWCYRCNVSWKATGVSRGRKLNKQVSLFTFPEGANALLSRPLPSNRHEVFVRCLLAVE